MGNEISVGRRQRSKKKKVTTSSADSTLEDTCMDSRNVGIKASKRSPPQTELSAASFGHDSANPWEREYDPVMITDVLTDVKERYHINPKE